VLQHFIQHFALFGGKIKRPESAGGDSSLAAYENAGLRDYAACSDGGVITSSGAMSG
jgi:hypothetical protein